MSCGTFQGLINVVFIVVHSVDVIQGHHSSFWDPILCDIDGRVSILILDKLEDFPKPKRSDL